MDYKTEFYENYYRTHVLPRKGAITAKQLDKKRKVFDLHFREFLPKDQSAAIVDAGCGNGSLVYWLQKRGFENASGVDGSPDQIAAGQALGIANLQAVDLVSHLRQTPDAYDLVFLRDVVEHFEKEHVIELLRICRASLKPGGRLVVQVPNGASPFVGRVLYGDFTHEVAYTESSLSQVFLIAGFENLQFRPFLPHRPRISWRSPFNAAGRSAIARRLAWSLVSRFYALLLFAELGRHSTITTFNIIAAASRPK